MLKNNSGKRIRRRGVKQRSASPVKIAYYIQRLLEKKMNTKEIILIISSQFGNKDIRKFAKMYSHYCYIEDIRHIANLIYNISKKNMDEVMDTVLHDVHIKKEILSGKYPRAHSSDQQKKINLKVCNGR